jgi:hypothetical protein
VKSAAWRSKIRDISAQVAQLFFFDFFLVTLCSAGGPAPFAPV